MIENDTATLCKNLEAAIGEFPGLTVIASVGGASIEGVIELSHDGVCFGSFLISIVVDHQYPRSQPICTEIGGRIPKTQDYHTNPNGTLCLGVPEDLWLRMNGTFEIKPFIDRCVLPFLVGIACKSSGQPWPYGERSHGAAGICEFYGERFGTIDPTRALDIIDALLGNAPKGHWACPCGSGVVVRKCHRSELTELRNSNIPRNMLEQSATVLANLIARGLDGRIDELQLVAARMRRILGHRAAA